VCFHSFLFSRHSCSNSDVIFSFENSSKRFSFHPFVGEIAPNEYACVSVRFNPITNREVVLMYLL
jgi:hypothetical protein